MHAAKWKKSNPKGYSLHDSIFIPFWKRQKAIGRENISGCQGLGDKLTKSYCKRELLGRLNCSVWYWGDGYMTPGICQKSIEIYTKEWNLLKLKKKNQPVCLVRSRWNTGT